MAMKCQAWDLGGRCQNYAFKHVPLTINKITVMVWYCQTHHKKSFPKYWTEYYRAQEENKPRDDIKEYSNLDEICDLHNTPIDKCGCTGSLEEET